jgi:hypothetical protein
MVKVLSIVIWLVWGAMLGRVLLAPFVGLTLGQSLLMLLIGGAGIALLFWFRWIFRPRAPAGSTSG